MDENKLNENDILSDEEYSKLPALTDADAITIAEAIAAVLDNKKAMKINTVNVHAKTVIADYFVIATGNSNTHLRSLVDEVEHRMELRGLPVHGIEGRDNNSWIVMDYSCVLVHIFTRDTREFYNLDKLYS